MQQLLDCSGRSRRATLTVTCDRCGAQVNGVSGEFGTAGFYYVGSGYWSLYARPGEANVCDRCMWTDPGFRHDYLITPFGTAEARDRRLGLDRTHPVRGSRLRRAIPAPRSRGHGDPRR